MSKFSFVEAYRSSGLPADSDLIKLRQPAFESVMKLMQEDSKGVELARLYFGLSPDNVEWFREPFFEADPTFSIAGNANEVAILAACLIEATEDKVGMLAVFNLSAFGARQPIGHEIFLHRLLRLGTESQISYRAENPANPEKIRVPSKDSAAAAIEELSETQDFIHTVAALRSLNADSQSAANSLALQTKGFATSLVNQMDVLNEKMELLWWYTGGWSQIINKPFADMTVESASLFAGLDVASLSRTLLGPANISAILYRILNRGRSGALEQLKLSDIIGSIDKTFLANIKVSDLVRRYSDICPVLAAAQRAAESDGWQEAFEKSSGLSKDCIFTPTNLAVQVFREASILNALERSK